MTTLVLLPGMLGVHTQFDALRALVGDVAHHALDLPGHGPRELAAAPQGKPFSLDALCDDTLAQLDALGVARAVIAGHSLGGYIGLELARRDATRIAGVWTLGTKLWWDPSTAAREARRLDADTIAAKVPAWAAELAARHTGTDWRALLPHVAALLDELGGDNPLAPEKVASIDIPVRICVGDRDAMVSIEESVAVYRALPRASLDVLPSTPHPLEQTDPSLLATSLHSFMATMHVTTG
jgi:pimeloyl-ACP methyl ester carboxylesterase